MHYSSNGRLFSGEYSSDFFNGKKQSIINEINSKSTNELLNISVEQYAEYLTSINTIEFPIVEDSNYTISTYESDVKASRFPPEFAIRDRNISIKKDVVVFHVPYSGDISYLNLRPSGLSLAGAPPMKTVYDEFRFEYINFYNKQDGIKREFDEDLRRFMNSYNRLKAEFEGYNKDLKKFIAISINNRRESLLAKNNFLASFNVPLKSNEKTSNTFAVPSPKLREKIKVSKPITSNTAYIPEPTLDYTNYLKILKLINDVGKNFERLPSVYKNKEEEDLRDHIIMVLDPNFEYGSATGETFNKKGKTDILLRYDSSVVFVAECKFWAGEKSFHKTIDQLLSYLTWRDSKTAVVIFVQTKEIIPILSKIKEVTPTHDCFITTKDQKAENWSEHIFHLPSDKNKEVILSILIFHLPV